MKEVRVGSGEHEEGRPVWTSSNRANFGLYWPQPPLNLYLYPFPRTFWTSVPQRLCMPNPARLWPSVQAISGPKTPQNISPA